MKKTLLALCAGVLALSASAENYKLGEAFCYPINPSFQWFAGDEDLFAQNDNWPADALQGQASLEKGWGLGMVWFAQHQFETLAQANEEVPVVADPWDTESYAIKMHANTAWWAYGNFNFALPQMNQLSRIRVVYRVDVENFPRYNPDNGKPFHVRLYHNANQDDSIAGYHEQIHTYWDNQGWRVVDIYNNLDADNFYLALTFDGKGLSCGKTSEGDNRPPFYLKELSVVPVSKLEGDTHVANDVNCQVVQECPELVVVDGENSINEISAVAEKAAEGIYDLQGRKVAKAAHGLYIINGVKTLVK